MTNWHLVDGDRARRALSGIGMIGPYFVVRQDAASPGLPLGEFLATPALRDLVGDVAHRLGTTESRVAVSSLQYEIAERLWSVVLGLWVTAGVVPDLDALRYGRSLSGRVRLHLQNPSARENFSASAVDTADVIGGVVLDQLTSLHHSLRPIARVAHGLLWGNAATALVLVTETLLNRSRPSRGLVAVSRAILARPPLSGRLDGNLPGPMKRRTCCLYYRTAAQRCCGDCPLTESEAVRTWHRDGVPQ